MPFAVHRDKFHPVSLETLAEAEDLAAKVDPDEAWQIFENVAGESWGRRVRGGIGPARTGP